MTFSVDLDLDAYNRAAVTYLSTLTSGAAQATRASADDARQHIAGGAYWTPRTGKTGQSFGVDAHPEGLGATLRSRARVALFLDAGTRPHPITARRRDALRFVTAGGATLFRRSVHHPGTKPRAYADAEATRQEPSLAAAVDRAADLAAERSGLG